MAIDFVMAARWGPITHSGPLQNKYWRIPFEGAPHIIATSYLAEVSIGGRDGQAGVALAAFKRFEFLDDRGGIQETELTKIVSFVEVERCVSITVALDLVDATACGGWTFFWVS